MSDELSSCSQARIKVVSETHTKLESWKGVPLAPERDHTILPRDRRDAKPSLRSAALHLQ